MQDTLDQLDIYCSNLTYYVLVIERVQVRTGPGNPGKPSKILETLKIPGNPWNFLKALSYNLLKKYIREVVHFIDFVTSSNPDFRLSNHFKSSFCVRNHCFTVNT